MCRKDVELKMHMEMGIDSEIEIEMEMEMEMVYSNALYFQIAWGLVKMNGDS